MKNRTMKNMMRTQKPMRVEEARWFLEADILLVYEYGVVPSI